MLNMFKWFNKTTIYKFDNFSVRTVGKPVIEGNLETQKFELEDVSDKYKIPYEIIAIAQKKMMEAMAYERKSVKMATVLSDNSFQLVLKVKKDVIGKKYSRQRS